MNCYQQRYDTLILDDFTAGCYAVMAPKGESIKIMEQVGKEMLQPETNPFRTDDTPLEPEGRIYGRLVAKRHKEQRNRHMDDLALHVSNVVMMASDPPDALTRFIRSIEAWVYAEMQSAPPQELNKGY